MSRRKRKFNLYEDRSTDPHVDWAVKGLMVLVEAAWAIVSGIAGVAWKLLVSLVYTEDKRKRS